ncbi:hypothetical protein KEJ36_00795 [Candidatus Bathyarchaeota archaeon]|nr:hypothetical protein [Candidatus Bathyarchaeota archaeon]MBS7627362.1 hypothetical protein [Candidatus Bathyarchaeota archaeon]
MVWESLKAFRLTGTSENDKANGGRASLSQLDHAISNMERTYRLMEMRNKWIEEMDLRSLDRLQEAMEKLDIFVTRQNLARIAEFRASILSVARDPRLNKAQKVVQMASQIEMLEKEGVIKIKEQTSLISLGMLLIAIPEPTMVSDVLGLMLVAMGMVLEKRRRR